MYLVLILTILHFVSSSEERTRVHGERDSIKRNSIILNRKNLVSPHNATYIDKAENMLRVPVIRKYFEEQKSKRKIKKSPKRTIQKIIRRSHNKSKKLYMQPVTEQSSPQPKRGYDKVYFHDDSQRREDSPTTQSNQKKKQRKWKAKVARYPMPFHNLQKKDYKFKRNADREDLYILKDLDEVEFLSSDKDYDVVNAHVKNYW